MLRGEAKVILPKAYCINLQRNTTLWTSIVFTRVFFDFLFRFLFFAMDGKIEQRVCTKFCVKLGKSANETLKMFVRLLEKIL
jgi:hypothetical protein